jgi:hypothetical protein
MPSARKPAGPARKIGAATTGRTIHLPEDIHDRLSLLARKQGMTVALLALDILDRALPRFKGVQEG